MEISYNGYIRFRPTSLGREVMAKDKRHNGEFDSKGRAVMPFWLFMNTFGAYCRPGYQAPTESDVEFFDEYPKEKHN